MKIPSILRTADGKSVLLPFILVATCFALWGFANDLTNPMVKAFSKIFRMSVADGSLVQLAFYGGYFVMALPAALYIRRHSYKSGLIMGLALYAIGALLFAPAATIGSYYPFLLAYFIMTCGLSFLETSANPYILALGNPATATRRLNLAQAFNPIGSLLGMYVAMQYIQSRLNPMSSAERATLDTAQFEALKNADLSVLVAPNITLGIVIAAILLCFILIPLPPCTPTATGDLSLRATVGRLLRNKTYRQGVVAQFFYVGAQIMCWTFIIQYGTRIFMAEGMTEIQAEVLSQKYNILAMISFCISRFICTYLMNYIKPQKLLTIFAIAAAILTIGVICIDGRAGLYCLVAISVCMSLMFPTIYALALGQVGQDTQIGAAGLIMAILGGSVLPPMQAHIIDQQTILGHPAVNISFILPLLSFIIVAMYGRKHYEGNTY